MHATIVGLAALWFGHLCLAGTLVEDFSTDNNADYSATTGIWNTVDHIARAGAVVAGNSAKTISFGDGSDGSVDTGNGYTFDTNSHPNGYNFKYLNITGGTITVTGSNTLVIRSLTTINISPSISVKGGTGNNGSSTSTATVSGGTTVTCLNSGGTGGTASGVANDDTDGGDGIKYDNSTEVGSAGARGNGANASDANATITGPGAVATWDTTANAFVCGTSGAGGGGSSPGGGNYSSGGSGGGGGGAIRIIALGDLTVGTIDVTAGDGGVGLMNGGGTCSGHGSAGVGGAAWLQTLKTMTAPAPTITAANSGTGNGCGAGAGAGVPGKRRGDANASGGAFAATSTTANAAASTSYVVQSKGYDLNTLNATFTNQASITSQENSGSISVSFAGSADNVNYGSFTNDITSLSNKNYRYIKFKIDITTAGVAGTSPQVSQISVDYSDAGLETLDLNLSIGCGSISNISKNKSALSDRTDQRQKLLVLIFFWLFFWVASYLILRKGNFYSAWVITILRAILNVLPAKSRPEIM